jgi:predicted PurR-regulated permease PerM
MKDLIVSTYAIYLPIAILLTFLVARIFFKNSKIFMSDIFNGRQDIAMSTNKLFETGFYLLNLGFALFYMKINKHNYSVSSEGINFGMQDMFEVLSHKVGSLSVFLGAMVFFLLFMLFRGKKKSRANRNQKVVQPTT